MTHETNLKVRYPDNPFIFIPVIVLLIIAWGLNQFFSDTLVTLLTIILGVLSIAVLLFHVYRVLAIDLEDERIQQQATQTILKLLDIRLPLPAMGRWAINPELGSTILEYILLMKPSYIVEAGSGTSTLISSYALEKLGSGTVYSLDHDKIFGEKTKLNVHRHNLDHIALVHVDDFKNYTINSKNWKWYNFDKLDTSKTIDVLVVDGPPEKLQDKARFPALPLLYERLSKKSVVILDDAYRDNELQIVKQWLDLYPEFQVEYKGLKKGIAVLTRGF